MPVNPLRFLLHVSGRRNETADGFHEKFGMRGKILMVPPEEDGKPLDLAEVRGKSR
jgi:hypothetical protein